MVLYGRNPVREALRARRRGVEEIWATEHAARDEWLRESRDPPLRIATADEIAGRCSTEDHQGVCARVEPYPYVSEAELLAAPEPLLVVLDEVQDPQNLGAICRSAEVAGATGVVIPERRAAQVTAAVAKASAGAVEHLAIGRVRNIADFLAAAKEAGCWCYGAAADGPVHYGEPDYRGGTALVLGAEGKGLRPRVAAACDALIAIPVRGRIESLNVSAAAAVLLYAVLQSRVGELDKGP